jgi:phosphoglycolate phosphatase-like HAD superfamily hydrolase
MARLKQKRKRLLISDFDGTLYDSLGNNYQAFKEVFNHYKVVPPTIEEFRMGITKLMDNFYYAYGISKNVPLEDIQKIRHQYRQKHYYKNIIFTDVVPIFQEIKNTK